MKSHKAIALRAALALAAAAGLATATWYGYDLLARQPIAAVRFIGDVTRVPPTELERLVAGLHGRNVALPAVREAVKSLPWVRECVVRRVFPGKLVVAIETHEALARWDDTRLVSTRGEVFTARFAGELPRFVGPEGTAAEMVSAWPGIVGAAAPLGSPVTLVRLTPRQAWQAKLASGLVIELGRGEIEARLARFAALWPFIAEQAGKATHADLRYPSGFALRAPAANVAPAAPKGPRA